MEDRERHAEGGDGLNRTSFGAADRRVTTFQYEGGRLVGVVDASVPRTVYTYEAPEPRPGPFVLKASDAFGRSVEWTWETATPPEDRAGLERDFVALLNAIDLLPVLSHRWRLRSFRDRTGRRDDYAHDDATGTVSVTAVAGGGPAEYRHALEARLVRVTDAETGMATHVVEPATAEVVYEVDASGDLRRAHPPGAVHRLL